MSADALYRFPFARWRRSQVHKVVARAREELGGAFAIEVVEPDPDSADAGSFEVFFEERVDGSPSEGALHRGRLALGSGSGEERAYVRVEAARVDAGALESADRIAMVLCDVLGGAPEADGDDATVAREGGGLAPALRFASWDALRDHLVARYGAQVDDGTVNVTWSWSETERTQLVQVVQSPLFDEAWVLFRSPVAPVARVPVARLFEHERSALGALVRQGTEFALHATLPLDALSVERLADILNEIASDADNAEEALMGTDEL